jgi:hypothetical protein
MSYIAQGGAFARWYFPVFEVVEVLCAGECVQGRRLRAMEREEDMRKQSSIVALLVGVFMAGSAARAASGPILWIDDDSNNIGTVNISTGAVTLVGNAGSPSPGLGDIAFDSNGNLWGVDIDSNFYSINSTTGAATLVGNTGDGVGFNSLVGGANGSLYAAGYNSTNLYTINSATGKDTNLGNIGFDAAGDLAFVSGTLYESALDPAGSGNDVLVKITLGATPSATEVGSFGLSDVYGLASDNNGVLYALSGTVIYTVNLNTAALTEVLDYGDNDVGLTGAAGEAFLGEASGAVPTVPLPPAAWSALAMLAGLAGIGAVKKLRPSH